MGNWVDAGGNDLDLKEEDANKIDFVIFVVNGAEMEKPNGIFGTKLARERYEYIKNAIFSVEAVTGHLPFLLVNHKKGINKVRLYEYFVEMNFPENNIFFIENYTGSGQYILKTHHTISSILVNVKARLSVDVNQG